MKKTNQTNRRRQPKKTKAKRDPFAELKKLRRWTAWKHQIRENSVAKIPKLGLSKPARVDEPNSWLKHKDAVELARKYKMDGIGILLGVLPNRTVLAGIDLDSCRDRRTKKFMPWALSVINALKSYTEVSPSMEGAKIFCAMSPDVAEMVAQLCKQRGSKSGSKWSVSGEARHPPSIEFYAGDRYFTVTGRHVKGTPRRIRRVDAGTLNWLFGVAGPALQLSGTTVIDVDELASRGTAVLALARTKAVDDPKLVALLNGDFSEVKDASRSGLDFTLGKHLKRLGFTREEMCAAILAYEHGAGKERHAANDLRYFDRIWERAKVASENVPRRERPTVKLYPGDLAKSVNETEQALLRAELDLFRRGDLIVRPVLKDVEAAGGRTVTAYQLPRISQITMLELMATSAKFQKANNAGEWKDVDCPPQIAAAYLARGNWKLPSILGVINSPTMRADGSILDTPGYDRATKLYFDPLGAVFPAIPKSPGRTDAQRAFKTLSELVSTFPFVTDADTSVAISGILTGLVRHQLRTAPLHAFTAPAAGTGKSMLVDVCTIVPTGAPCPVQAQGATKEEAEKRVAASLIAGDAVFSIDNCQAPLGGDLLCQALTQSTVSPRILGKSQNVQVPTCATIYATGNNLRIFGDLGRRTLLCALDAQCERPELRKFKRDACDYAEANRGNFVVAGLTILRAYHLAGNPAFEGKKRPLGSFGQWSKIVRNAIIWAGGADPCSTMQRAYDSDPEREQLASLIAAWKPAIGEDAVTLRDAIERSEGNGKAAQDLKQAFLVVASDGGAVSARRLGLYLSKHQSRLIEGLRIVKAPGRRGVVKWRLEHV